MNRPLTARRSLPLAFVAILAGAIGWYAAFRLVLDKLAILADKDAVLDCNLSVLVSCGKNLDSWQGAIFGFSNPILGVAGFVAPIAVGVGLIAGARYARWFWVLFNAGVLGAFAFCLWLAYQSIFELSTLCPWCMVVWAVTIPLFWTLTLDNARHGVFGRRARRLGSSLYSWVPAITIVGYLIIAVVAQVRLDVLSTL